MKQSEGFERLPGPERELLGQAIDYALACADLVTPALFWCPTPCCAWDLGMLLAHFGDSLDALAEGFTDGTVSLLPASNASADAGAAGLRSRCDRLRAAAAMMPASPADLAMPELPGTPNVAGTRVGQLVAIGGNAMPDAVLCHTGAIEIAVHGWDIAAACGTPRPLPAGLATPLLAAAPTLIPASIRPGLFAPPLRAPRGAPPGDQLLAFLGRARPG